MASQEENTTTKLEKSREQNMLLTEEIPERSQTVGETVIAHHWEKCGVWCLVRAFRNMIRVEHGSELTHDLEMRHQATGY